MAADFIPKPQVQEFVSTSGQRSASWRLLGVTGAAVVGKGGWIELDAFQWKTFQLLPLNHISALGAVSVEIHGTMELVPTGDVDANTNFIVLGTLTAASKRLGLEESYRFVRAEVKVAPATAVQVLMYAMGL